MKDAAQQDWDAPGVLSIVVQGPLSNRNLVETANHCLHWRQLFPTAELILVISVTDILIPETLALAASLACDGTAQAALSTLRATCDRIAFADAQLPLPPIKSDTASSNNINFQIAAAQKGLALAGSRFVLRVRSDLTFLDRSFLDQYAEAEQVPRGRSSVLTRRILISWLFTLNPFTVERLPLHFSDWFHFGLTDDVRRLWDVPFVTLRDSVHYRAHRFALGSNAAERLFNTRLAVEQHIAYHAFRDLFPQLELARHNDLTSVDLSLDILVDNFALCDLERARCVFDKYASEFGNPGKQIHCLTRDDWFALARDRATDPRRILAAKIAAHENGTGAPSEPGLPRTIPAAALVAEDATLLNGELVARSREGVMFSAPKIALPVGRYLARVDVTSLTGQGSVMLSITAGNRQDLLAERVVVIEGSSTEIVVTFDVVEAGFEDLTVTCHFTGLTVFAVAGLVLAVHDGSAAVRHQQAIPWRIDPARLLTKTGVRVDGDIVSTGQDGTLFYGPYLWLVPGRYTARVDTGALDADSGRVGSVTLSVTRASGSEILAQHRVNPGTPADLAIDFEMPGQTATKFEVVCDVSGVRQMRVTGIEIVRRAEPTPETERRGRAPRLAWRKRT